MRICKIACQDMIIFFSSVVNSKSLCCMAIFLLRLSIRLDAFKKRKNMTLVLGVGNVLMKDDGAGVRAVEMLEGSKHLPEGIRCVDGGVAGLNLLTLIEGFIHLIIVDAVRFGEKPGTVKRLKWNPGLVIPKATVSAHGLGVSELLALASIGGKCPETIIIGIEPEDVRHGLELTPTVENALPAAVAAIMKEIKTGGKRHARVPCGAKNNRGHKKRNVEVKGKKA